ncbi:MAG TPA: hypothetical protein VFD49_16585 [Candidatus Dormibacteraeota bacterium]|nr:hypothetical protein [Candidatus Dormibacteraeota bacterium]
MQENAILSVADVARWETMPAAELESELEARGLWDGLPLAPPSSRRLRELLAAAPGTKEPLALIPPLRGAATVEAVAVAAALAGCDARQLPVVLAAVRALAAPELNALGVLTTTGNAALMVVVNGPAARAYGYRGDSNCLGPGNRSNAVTGRALSLVCRALGGAREGLGDMATMGQPAKYGFCFAENEAQSPWEPYSVERGFAPHESTVTVVGISGVLEVFNGESSEPGDLLQTMAEAMAVPAALYTLDRRLAGGGHPFVLMSPEWAASLSGAGFSKADVKRELHRRARWRQGDRELAVAVRPEDVHVLVAGGVGIKQTFVPNWSGGSVPVTVGL